MNQNIITEFIQNNRQALDAVMDLVPIPMFIKDRAGHYLDCNHAFTEFLSFRREEIIGRTAYDLWKKKEADIFFEMDESLFVQGGIQIYEAGITASNGITHIVQFHKQVFTDDEGKVTGFLGVIFDITEKKKLEEKLSQLAVMDELTGLPNRRDGMTRLEALHKESKRKKRPYCIAMLDIDNFKQINDRYGHYNGDIVLKEFGSLVKNELRCSDVCFRYGGEEFAILLPETKLTDGFVIAERVRTAWEQSNVKLADRHTLHSTISAGIAQLTDTSVSYEQLLQTSDRALYEAKNSGRNRSVCLEI